MTSLLKIKKYPENWDRDKKAGYFWRTGFLDKTSSFVVKKNLNLRAYQGLQV